MTNEQLIAVLREIRDRYALSPSHRVALAWCIAKLMKE